MFYIIFNYWRKFINETSKDIYHLHKASNDLLLVIIISGIYVHGGETVFFNVMGVNDIGKISCVLKNSHRRCVVGTSDKIVMKDIFGLDP